jgi:hypothetical protein
MIIVCLFYYPLIVLWVIGPMVKGDYPLAIGSVPGTQTFVGLSPANNLDEGLVESLK